MARLTLRHSPVDSPTRLGALRGPIDAQLITGDVGSGTDNSTAPAVSISATQTAAGLDVVFAESVTLSATTETAAGLDTSAQTRFISSSAETGTGADSSALAAAFAVIDTGVSGSQLVATLAAALSVSDASGPGTDHIVALSAQTSDTDSASGIDASTLSVFFTALVDLASGLEGSSVVAAALSAFDVNGFLEGLSLDQGNAFTVNDAAVGADSALALAVDLGTASDSAAGSEIPPSNLSFNASSESGTAAEFAVVEISVSAFDAATGDDETTAPTVLVTAVDVSAGIDSFFDLETDINTSESWSGFDTSVPVLIADNAITVFDSAFADDEDPIPDVIITASAESGSGTDTMVRLHVKHKYPLLVVERNRDTAASETKRALVVEGPERWA